jgi:hypothetical protein
MIIDTDTSCTKAASFLVQRGVEAVGRYYATLNPNKVIKKPEARALCSRGIRLFTVFEDFGAASRLKLTEDQGGQDGKTARLQALKLEQPVKTVIYFAVEGLPDGYKTADLPKIRDYFRGIRKALGNDYTAGVYGDGIVCQTLLDESICSHTWLAQASWAFQGSMAFYASKRWNLAQIVTDLPRKQWRGLSVDINEGANDTGSFLVPTGAQPRRRASRKLP